MRRISVLKLVNLMLTYHFHPFHGSLQQLLKIWHSYDINLEEVICWYHIKKRNGRQTVLQHQNLQSYKENFAELLACYADLREHRPVEKSNNKKES